MAKFAVIQYGCALFGEGETREEAIRDAAEWITTKTKAQGQCSVDDVEELLNHGNGDRVAGMFYVTKDQDEIASHK